MKRWRNASAPSPLTSRYPVVPVHLHGNIALVASFVWIDDAIATAAKSAVHVAAITVGRVELIALFRPSGDAIAALKNDRAQ